MKLKRKLTLIALLASVGGVLLTNLFLIYYDQTSERQQLDQELETLANVVAHRSISALLFEDAELGKENLVALDSYEAIVTACLVSSDGGVFSEFNKSRNSKSCSEFLKNSIGLKGNKNRSTPLPFSKTFIWRSVPIVHEQTVLGSVYLVADLRFLNQRVIEFIMVALLVSLIVGVLLFLIISRIQKSVSRPLLNLAEMADYISQNKDFSVRANHLGDNEFSQLASAFNGMLQTIEDKNSETLKASQELQRILQVKSVTEQRLRGIFNAAPDGILTVDYDGKIQSMNGAALQMFSYDEKHIVGKHIDLLIPELDLPVADYFTKKGHSTSECIGLKSSGETLFLELKVSSVELPDNTLFTFILRDVTQANEMAERLRILSRAVEQSPSSVVIADLEGEVEYVNASFEHMTGVDSITYLAGQPDLSSLLPADAMKEIKKVVSKGLEWRGIVKRYREDDSKTPYWESVVVSPIRLNGGQIKHILRIGVDITVQKEQEERLIKQANYDALTGLPNRMLAYDRLQKALVSCRRNGLYLVLMFLDLDRFKYVNDTLGHEAGDQLLIEAANRLEACMREECTVARLGGDEFVIIISDLINPLVAEVLAHRIMQAFEEPFVIEKQSFFISTSIGISIFPDDGEDVKTLLKNADSAMYRAKELGRSNFQFFTEDLNDKANERIEIESKLRQALEADAFRLDYQPILRCSNGDIVAVEALLRWPLENGEECEPQAFIPIAEESELITKIDQWVLRNVCKQLQQWILEGFDPGVVGVNISAKQFRDVNFVADLIELLNEFELSGSFLSFEITEKVLLHENDEIRSHMQALKSLGTRLTIDDFGTGYSALSYLQNYAIDILKMDVSFIHNAVLEQGGVSLCASIVKMAHSLGIKVVAEGVETQEQLKLLDKMGCDYYQGRVYSQPLPSGQLSKLVKRHLLEEESI